MKNRTADRCIHKNEVYPIQMSVQFLPFESCSCQISYGTQHMYNVVYQGAPSRISEAEYQLLAISSSPDWELFQCQYPHCTDAPWHLTSESGEEFPVETETRSQHWEDCNNS
uniref:Uncharacterized protein n=1 Tax=Opuntia streptacantha TaxID=393608 RepID=A0A7C9AM09_OPUST